VEAAGKPPENAQQQAPQQAGAQNSGNFEAQIREVLGNQQRPLGDGYTGGDPQYRTQTYSRGGAKVNE
jgi:aspartokinase